MKRALCLIIFVSLLFSFTSCGEKGNSSSWQEKYDLGCRYLSEGNYEEAIIAFTAAIEIDSKRFEAFEKRGNTYIALSEISDSPEAYKELCEKALNDYLQAFSLGNSTIQEKIDLLQATIEGLEDNAAYQTLLKDLYTILSSNDIDGAKMLMRNEKYIEMSYATGEDCFIYQEKQDFCLAVYNDNCYYFGQWKESQRNGHGLWIKAVFDDSSSIDIEQYEGAWVNDLPNGKGVVTTIRDLERLHLSEGQTTSIITEVMGSFKNGLYDGEIYEIWHMNDGDIHEWTPITAVDGIYQAMDCVPENIKSSPYYEEYIASGRKLVAVDKDSVADLWDSGSVNAIFGMEKIL